MLEELYMRDLANAMKMPEEVLPAGKVTVSGPQVETQPKQPEMGTITGIPQTAFEKALEASGIKLSELGDMIDQSAPGTLNTLLGRDIPVVGNLKLRDFLPFVGSKDDGKLTGTPAALIAAGTGQPLRGQPVVSSTVGPDGRTYFSASGSPAMLNEDVGTAVVDVATLGLGKPLAAGAKKAVKATKNMPVGMSTKAVGQGVDELGFYSAAKQAVDAIQQPKGTGQQFLKQIEKTPGVKPDEIKWTGLDEFLQSKKSVTKAEVQEYLDKNRVEIKEVTLADGGLKKKFSVDSPEDQDFYDVIDKQGKVIFTGPEDDADYLIDRSLTKFSKYTLPGGENYREILLTLPDNRTAPTFEQWLDNYTMMTLDQVNADPRLMEIAQNSYKTDVDKLPRVGGFRSQHFDQPNILAHIRVNDRVIDGKKTLFVEEVQSDWHQAGRKKGYTPKDADKLEARRKELEDIGINATPEQKQEWADIMNRLRPDTRDIESNTTGYKGVPDAPFKGNWQELAMKRAIQMATEGGYDRVAFTTGKTQAARYDLSKEISEVSLSGTNLVAYDKQGNAVIKQTGVTKDNLSDYIGKEPAQKLLDQEPQGTLRTISGLDLQVGGEGMKGFYDNILPKFLNNYAKKWDAKTGTTNMRIATDAQDAQDSALLRDLGMPEGGKASVQVNYIDVTPKMRESVVTKGQPMFAIGAGGAGAAATQEENK